MARRESELTIVYEELQGVHLAIFVYWLGLWMHSLETLTKGDSACVNTVTGKQSLTHSVVIPAVCCCLWRHRG